MKIRTLLLQLWPLFFLLVFPACQAKVPREQGDIPLISGENLRKILSDRSVLLVDNRPEANYAEGHIPGAVNLPYLKPGDPSNVMTFQFLQEAARGKHTIIFYCFGRIRGPNALRAAREWEIPAKMFVYKEGFPGWIEQGGKVEK